MDRPLEYSTPARAVRKQFLEEFWVSKIGKAYEGVYALPPAPCNNAGVRLGLESIRTALY